MKRTIKYTLYAGGIALLLTTLALLDFYATGHDFYHLSLSNLILHPGYHLTRRLLGDMNWDFHDTLIQGITITLVLNTAFCAILGMLVALASPPLDRPHRKRIKRFGIKTAIVTAVLTTIVFILLLTIENDLPNVEILRYVITPVVWLGAMQAWYLWGDGINSSFEAYAYGMLFGVPVNALLGFGLGCLIAAFTARWAILPIKHGCPQCDYDLTGTPDHCPECGWVGKPVEKDCQAAK